MNNLVVKIIFYKALLWLGHVLSIKFQYIGSKKICFVNISEWKFPVVITFIIENLSALHGLL